MLNWHKLFTANHLPTVAAPALLQFTVLYSTSAMIDVTDVDLDNNLQLNNAAVGSLTSISSAPGDASWTFSWTPTSMQLVNLT